MRFEVFAESTVSWPRPADTPSVLLLQSANETDEDVLAEWLRSLENSDAGGQRTAADGTEALRRAGADDAWIVPIRVAWLPPGEDGDRRWRGRDLPMLRHASGLSNRSRRRILASEPSRCRILIGEPAMLGDLRARMQEQAPDDATPELGEFVDRQAQLTLDRAERALTGGRYKVPRDVKTDLVSERRFEQGLGALAGQLGRPVSELRLQALSYLEEMSCTQSPLVRELWVGWAKLLYSRAYTLDFDPDTVRDLRELARSRPLVFLPTHKSNLDGYVMAALMHEAGFPPNHTLGGINMAFWPLGAVGRRVGVIWIRRTIREDPVYRWVLSQYLAYLVGRRFNLEWYIEGGRTRTGKLLPPKMGLLHYLVEAVREAEIDDVTIVPVSIVYDQLEEVAEMTAESRGAVKPAEGLPWLLGYARRQNRALGRVQVRFGQPLEMTPALAAYGEAEDPRLALSKLAFEVCTRMNQATPVTPTGLVTLALLGIDGRSLSSAELVNALGPLRRYVAARQLPGCEEASSLATAAGVNAALASLVEHGVVACYDAGPEPVYAIGRQNELVAAFYRNGVIHWFVNRSIAELALVRAADCAGDVDSVELAWEEAYRLRDLLKFEFFFADQETFRSEMKEELALIEPAWSTGGELDLSDVGAALVASGAVMAHRVLISFVEAYHVVAEQLATQPSAAAVDEAAFISACLTLGEQMRRQHRISSGEAVSKELFSSGLKLARNRGLLDPDRGDLPATRAQFAAEVRDVIRRLRVVEQIDRSAAAETLEAAVVGGE